MLKPNILMKALLTGAVLAGIALTGNAAAHTEITHMVPAAGSRVAAPKTVTLDLNEPVNLRFSTFKVYALPAGSDAAALTKTKLNLKNDSAANTAARADLYPGASGLAARVKLPLKAGLKPGAYVVMWSLLSDDGHPVSGQSVFRIK